MNDHFKRFFPAYLVLLFDLLLPPLLYWYARVPVLDDHTLQVIARQLDADAERRYGKSVAEELSDFLENDSKHENHLSSFARDIRLQPVRPIVGKGVAISERAGLETVIEAYRPMLQRWDELSAHGRISPVLAPLLEVNNDAMRNAFFERQVYDSWLFSAYYRRSDLILMDAVNAIAKHDWTGAIGRLQTAAHSAELLRGDEYHLSGQVIRSNVYGDYGGNGGFGALLNADPPPEVSRAALESLRGLAASDPIADALWLRRLFLRDIITNRFGNGTPNLMALSGAYGIAASHAERINDPKLRAWMETTGHKPDSGLIDYDYWNTNGPLGWTRFPATVKWLKTLMKKEPWIVDPVLSPGEGEQGLDSWTLDIFSIRYPDVDRYAAWNRNVTGARQMMMASFAARLYRNDHGEWPAHLADLAPNYLTEQEALGMQSGKVEQRLNLGWLTADANLRSHLWERLWIPGHGDPRESIQRGIPGTMERVIGPQDEAWFLNRPVYLVDAVEGLLRHPKLVDEARLSAKLKSWRGLPTEWGPFDPEHAVRVTRESDEIEATRIARDTNPRPMGAKTIIPPDKTATQRPRQWNRTIEGYEYATIELKLRAPERVFAIWAFGPDGVDDGGKIIFDRGHGGKSAGDVLIFPEGY